MMRNTVFAAVLAAAGLVLGGAGSGRADIAVATVGPMTGSDAAFGAQMKAGFEQAVADLNAAGGVLGQKLLPEVGDDACDSKQAVAVANQMAGKGVKFVAGHFCSGSSIPASDVYAEEGIIQISPASTNPKFTEQGKDNVFRTCGRDDQQGAIAGDHIAANFKGKKIAIVHDKTQYGQGLAEETKKQLNKNGVKEVLFESINRGEKDFSALVSKLKATGADLLYFGGYYVEAGLLVRQMREQGMDTVLMGGDALVTAEYWSITGKLGEGTLMTFSPDPRKNPIAKPIVEKFRAKGIEPEGYTLYTYGAVQAWAQAVEEAKSTDTDEVIAALRKGEFETVLGKIGFDDKGDVTAPGYVVYIWQDGAYDYVK
jgi:branched-chain amino acid transport system substrate-binding protein